MTDRDQFCLAVFIIGILLLLAWCTSQPAESAQQGYEVYVVQPEDTLWTIAKKKFPKEHTGEMVYRIRELNSTDEILLSPKIWPGQRIKIPTKIVENVTRYMALQNVTNVTGGFCMALPWIRLYTEMLHDPKLRRLSASEKWIWTGLLLLAGAAEDRGILHVCEGVPYSNEDIADQLGLKDDEQNLVKPAMERFQQFKMVELDEDGIIYILNFDKRQYDKPSDKPEAVKERVKKHRQKVKRQCNANETPCNALDTDTDTDTDTEVITPLNPPEEKTSPDDPIFKNNNDNIYDRLEKALNRKLTTPEVEIATKWFDDIDPDAVLYAFDLAALQNKISVAYIEEIIFNWVKEKITTKSQAEEREQKFKDRKRGREPTNINNGAVEKYGSAFDEITA